MSVAILEGKDGYKAMYCNTTMWAFGGIFYEEEDPREFVEWVAEDPRCYTDKELESLISKWRIEKEQNDARN